MRKSETHPWIELLPVKLYGFDGDDDDDSGDDPQEGAEGGEGDEDEPKTFSQEYVDKLRKEAASRRVSGKEEADRVKTLEAELAEIKKAEMDDLGRAKTDLESTQKQVTELESRAVSAEKNLANERITNAVTMAALEAGFEDPTDALSMIPQDDLVDDQGEIDVTEIGKELKALAKKKPYLLKKKGAGSGDGGGGSKAPDPKTFEAKKDAYLKQMTETGGRVAS